MKTVLSILSNKFIWSFSITFFPALMVIGVLWGLYDAKRDAVAANNTAIAAQTSTLAKEKSIRDDIARSTALRKHEFLTLKKTQDEIKETQVKIIGRVSENADRIHAVKDEERAHVQAIHQLLHKHNGRMK